MNFRQTCWSLTDPGALMTGTGTRGSLQMQLYEVGRLSETQPPIAGGPLASFWLLGNCFVPAFGIPIAANFKFLHFDTRHHGVPLQQVFIGARDYDAFGPIGFLSRANYRIRGNREEVTVVSQPDAR
jgi:hypothetical protein